MNNMRQKILSLLVLLLTAATGAWAADTYTITFSGFGNEACNKTVTDATLEYSETFNVTDVYANYTIFGGVGGSNEYVSISKSQDETQITITVKSAFEGTVNVTVYYMNENWDESERNISVTCVKSAPGIEVTTNKAENETTFTEASFQMPAFDATADYELVRDMGYKVAFSGVPTRARLAKDGNGKFHFADGLTFQLLDNIDAANPKDITSAEGITFMVGEVVPFDIEGSTYYQLDKETLVPLADFLADAHLGNYAICAVASTGEYDGSFSSGMITLFQGYEVEIAAGEYATFYKEENLYVEDEDAELYTITSVGSETATAAPLTVAKAYTPILVKNKGAEKKTILLIPTATEGDEVDYAPEFIGTLTATTIAASSENQNNYAFNGLQFVWVKNAIAVGANKAWLSINTGVPSARGITLVFDETTKIANTNITNITNGDWYDLNGRKLDKMPTKKGVYLFNGRKVVVK